MKISLATMAFKEQPFLKTLEHLNFFSIKGLEISPTLFWNDPFSSTKNQRDCLSKILSSYGLSVVGLQSLFYNRIDLQIFGPPETQTLCREHLKKMIELCADLGGEVLILGAPKNRKREILSTQQALEESVIFFREIAEEARQHNVCFCIEPLSSRYHCDFILTADEGAQLVKQVAHSHFRLQLDVGSMVLNGESPQEMIAKHSGILRHVHINDPHLAAPGARGVNHRDIAKTLRDIGYQGWLTLEFLASDNSLEQDIAYAVECYGQ